MMEFNNSLGRRAKAQLVRFASPSRLKSLLWKMSGWSWLSVLLIVSVFWQWSTLLPGVEGKEKVDPVTALPLQFHEDHRLLPWCVNGMDEPEFSKYPWNEFAPIIQRKYFQENVEANQRYTYTTSLYPIKINMSSASAPGTGGNLIQRAHFVLKTTLRKEFATNVQLQYNKTKIEGLIVQANFIPFGVGLPVGEFVHPKLFNCVDCKKPVGIPIACRKRTHIHIMHPTIMAYHYKMKIPQEEKDRQKTHCYNDLTPMQCIVVGFKENKNFNISKIPQPCQVPAAGAAPPPAGTPGPPPCPPGPITIPIPPPGSPPPPPPPPGPGPPPNPQVVPKYYDFKRWASDPTFDKRLIKLERPLPGVAATCNTDADCNGVDPEKNPSIIGEVIQKWFESDCCTGDKVSGECNVTGITTTKKYCPNTLDTTLAPAGDATSFEGPSTTYGPSAVLENPYLQSSTWPIFKCKPFEVPVCRPVGFPPVPRYEDKESFQTDWEKAGAPELEPVTPSGAAPGTPATPAFNPFDDSEWCCSLPAGSPSCPAPPPVPAPPPGTNPPPPLPNPQKVCSKGDPIKADPLTECMKRVVWPIDNDDDPPTWQDPDRTGESNCEGVLKEDEYGRSDEVHGNFVWYMPPCRQRTDVLVRFQMLVVHSFQKGIYAIVNSEPYKLKPAMDPHNEHIPTPLFTGFPHFCESPVESVQYLFEKLSKVNFDYSRSYDACVQEVTGPQRINEQVCSGRVPVFTPATSKKNKGGSGGYDGMDFPRCAMDPNAYGNVLPCDRPSCPELPNTTPEYIATPGKGFFKRTLHGAINIITNFCIMPICVFIARFYKETYNLTSFKGQKAWYWMHMVGAGGSSIFMYLGYFTDKIVDNADPHLVYGNIYIICLMVSYMTAWIRHQNRWISMLIESIHSLCGYGCFVLALMCVTNAKIDEEPISDEVKYIVYVAIASLIFFYVGMSIHICALDRKFGMKPKRWHFPSVESRFDDLPVPGRTVRKIFLFAVLFINLPLTLSTLFI